MAFKRPSWAGPLRRGVNVPTRPKIGKGSYTIGDTLLTQEQDPNALKGDRVKAGTTAGLGPRGNTGRSGGSGAVGTPVSTLAGLPQTPLLAQLIKSGLIKEGMPPEQALAILSFAQMREGVPIDMAELIKQVTADYEKYTGDIETAGADWMKELMGTAYDPTDPNAAMFANDPTFSSYAGGLTQMGETADQNLATDLAWFTKNQAAQEQYYNDMMAAISTGTLPIGAAAAGGGGGGGGSGGGGYGGGGGGSGGGDGHGFSDPKTTSASGTEVENTATDSSYFNFPGFTDAILDRLSIDDPIVADEIESLLNMGATPDELLPALEEKMGEIDTENQEYRDIVGPGELVGSNELWRPQQVGELERMISDYEELTGMRIGSETPGEFFSYQPGDNPETTDEVETDWVPDLQMNTALLSEADAEELNQLEEFLMPALTAASPEGIGTTEPLSKTLNSVAYIRDLANKRLAGQQEVRDFSDVQQESNEQPQDVTDFLERITGKQGPSAVNVAPIGPNQQSSVAGNYTSGGWVPSIVQRSDPNVGPHIPMGTEVPNTPENNYQYYEETGSLPMTPLTDDPNAQAVPLPGGNSGTIPPAGTPEYDAYLAQAGQAMPGEVASPQFNVGGQSVAGGRSPLDDLRTQRNIPNPNVLLQVLAQQALQAPAQQSQPQAPEQTFNVGPISTNLGSSRLQQLLEQANIDKGPVAPTNEPGILGGMGGSLEQYRNAADTLGYNPQDAASANMVDPAAVRKMFLDRLILDRESGNLLSPIEEVMKKRSRAAWNAEYGDLDQEAQDAIYNQGEFWRDPRLTPEQYEQNEAVSNAIPSFIELTRQFSPDWTMATAYAKINEMIREEESLKSTSNSYDPEVALETASGLPNERALEDLNPVELAPEVQDENNSVAAALGLRGGNMPGHAPEIRGIMPRGGQNIDALLRQNATQMNLPATVTPAANPMNIGSGWRGGRSLSGRRGTSSANKGLKDVSRTFTPAPRVAPPSSTSMSMLKNILKGTKKKSYRKY